MISIQNEIRTAEDLQALLAAVSANYRAAVHDSSQYAVDLDPSSPLRIAKRCEGLPKESRRSYSVPIPRCPRCVRPSATYSGLQEKAEQYLGDLRGKLEEHASALQTALAL